MFRCYAIFTLLVIVHLTLSEKIKLPETTTSKSFKTLEEIYELAIQKYLKADYEPAIKLFKNVIVKHMMLQHSTISCNQKCENSSIAKELETDFEGFPLLEALGNKLAYGECFKVCMEGHPYRDISSQPLPPLDTLEELEMRQPYNYLQYAYYKTKSFKKSCEALTTYMQKNPTDQDMINNKEYYRTLTDVKAHYFKDIEAPKFHKSYNGGVEAYEDGEHKKAIKLIEEALFGYFIAFHECEVMCEKPYEDVFFHKIYKTIAVENVRTWKCIQECENELSPIILDWKVENFTARCFQFLQFAYYQLGETAQAVTCAASSYLLNPEADLAHQNVQFYKKHLEKAGFTEKDVSKLLHPRKDALQYFNRLKEIKDNINKVTSIFYDVFGDEETFEEKDEEDEEEEKEDEELSISDMIKMHIADQLTRNI